MSGPTAFQPSAFENDAFQIAGAVTRRAGGIDAAERDRRTMMHNAGISTILAIVAALDDD